MRNEQLIAARETRGWTQASLAEKMQVSTLTISRWEHRGQMPRPFMVMRLCRLFALPVRELGLSSSESTVAPCQDAAGGSDEMTIKRRELFSLLGLAGSTLLFPLNAIDWERIEYIAANPTHVDNEVIVHLQGIATHYWNLYLLAPSKASILDGTLGQLKVLTHLLKESHSSGIHSQLCEVVSELAQLIGEIFFDMHEPNAAQFCYTFAISAAREANAYDLWSSALIRHAFLPMYDDPPHYHDALPFLQSARRLADHGDTAYTTRYWVAAVEAEVFSGTGDILSCQEALDRADGVQHFTHKTPAWARFDGSRLPALRGASFVRLGRPDLAEPALQEALHLFHMPGRKRGMVLTDLATTAYQRKDVDQACSYLHSVLDIADLGLSAFLRESVVKVRRQMEPFAHATAVQRFDTRLQAYH